MRFYPKRLYVPELERCLSSTLSKRFRNEALHTPLSPRSERRDARATLCNRREGG